MSISSVDLKKLAGNEQHLMVFVACYLFSTIVLAADIDLQCQRIYPLNYAIWLAQTVCFAFIAAFIAVSDRHPSLILAGLIILLVIVTTNAIFGNLNFEHQLSIRNKII